MVRNRALRKESLQCTLPVHEQTESRASDHPDIPIIYYYSLANRAEYIYLISLSEKLQKLILSIFEQVLKRAFSYTLLIEIQTIICFKESSLAICVKSLLKMHTFCLSNLISKILS